MSEIIIVCRDKSLPEKLFEYQGGETENTIETTLPEAVVFNNCSLNNLVKITSQNKNSTIWVHNFFEILSECGINVSDKLSVQSVVNRLLGVSSKVITIKNEAFLVLFQSFEEDFTENLIKLGKEIDSIVLIGGPENVIDYSV